MTEARELRRIAVVTAGLSSPSSSRLLADRLGEQAVAALAERGIAAESQVIELRDLAVDVVTATVTTVPSAALRSALDAVLGADGVIAVSPVFNASYSGIFKSFVDLLEPGSLEGRPVVIGATGGSDRHSLVLDHALRPLFSYLRSVVLPTGVYAASADWGAAVEPGVATLEERVIRAGGELADAIAARPARALVGSDSADDLQVDSSFEDLLRSLD